MSYVTQLAKTDSSEGKDHVASETVQELSQEIDKVAKQMAQDLSQVKLSLQSELASLRTTIQA